MSQWAELERIAKAIEHLQTMIERLTSLLPFRRPVGFGLGDYLIEGAQQPKRYEDLLRKPAPEPADPRLITNLQKLRRMRAGYLQTDLFADPAWDILLELYVARLKHQQISVTSLCLAAEVPATTAQRWIALMVERGMLERRNDPDDRRRCFVSLAEPVARQLTRYFAEAGAMASHLI